MGSSDRLEPLRLAVAADPENGGLRLIYAQALLGDERLAEATIEYQALFVANELPPEQLVTAGRAALVAGAYTFASSLASRAHELGFGAEAAALRIHVNEALNRAAAADTPAEPGGAGPGWLDQAGTDPLTFADVGGLADVKKAIERLVILPYRQTETYRRFGRKAGGGVLLYGPPGCGKTLLAQATAGECELPFLNIRIENILNPYFGVSAQNLHAAFVEARNAAPCVVFIDEIDAIGGARKNAGVGRSLVDQLLQELDSIGSDNEGILVLAATNTPWSVDEALKRPGRFDRSVFVAPPDREARETILGLLVRDRPAEGLDLGRISERTALFSGADLRGLVEQAIDLAIDETIETGIDRSLTGSEFDVVLKRFVPSTLEWIATARRYVEFANDTGRYDDVRDFLKSREVKAR
ncbi:MAG TPA: ATP-binding protein [Gaiellaceae bacterium]|jgi:AAA+ superfamily predicted ATPase|nr:ATP-binding protein [Gaiellaceae bacterium]